MDPAGQGSQGGARRRSDQPAGHLPQRLFGAQPADEALHLRSAARTLAQRHGGRRAVAENDPEGPGGRGRRAVAQPGPHFGGVAHQLRVARQPGAGDRGSPRVEGEGHSRALPGVGSPGPHREGGGQRGGPVPRRLRGGRLGVREGDAGCRARGRAPGWQARGAARRARRAEHAPRWAVQLARLAAVAALRPGPAAQGPPVHGQGIAAVPGHAEEERLSGDPRLVQQGAVRHREAAGAPRRAELLGGLVRERERVPSAPAARSERPQTRHELLLRHDVDGPCQLGRRPHRPLQRRGPLEGVQPLEGRGAPAARGAAQPHAVRRGAAAPAAAGAVAQAGGPEARGLRGGCARGAGGARARGDGHGRRPRGLRRRLRRGALRWARGRRRGRPNGRCWRGTRRARRGGRG
mmetsp:Transcript_52261/g.136085  ORF Transcript_52261/g.136085 Transcript_52261/m.136085 type:complete len:407 (+) Transcript_52261:917-2137(+)